MTDFNEALLSPEEHEMPMEIGYAAAAERLGLIYLADVVAIAHVVSRFTEDAMKLTQDYSTGLLSGAQLGKAIDELNDRLGMILNGRNPRYMATPWFTDPTQLANHIFKIHDAAYQDDPENLVNLRTDPIREAAFLIITTAAEEDFLEYTTAEEWVIGNVRELLNIPETVPLDMLEVSQASSTSIQVRRTEGILERRSGRSGQ